jgi:hypothetical protein
MSGSKKGKIGLNSEKKQTLLKLWKKDVKNS